MLYQLPNGKVIHLTVEQFLDLTDLDIQHLIALDAGDHMINPFSESAVNINTKEKYYDFDYVSLDDDEIQNYKSDDQLFDDIIDLSGPLDN
jgi:hypothetical protein